MADDPESRVEKTLPMTVDNIGFIVDRLGQDCSPLQFLRELTQNAIEAILRTPEKKGEIIWDVDWDTFDLTGNHKLCIVDTGAGMTGPEMVKYINQLSSSVNQQSFQGNYGVGAKIAAAPRNQHGLVYLSWKSGVGSTIHLWRNPATGQYGLRQFFLGEDGFNHWAHVEDTVKPANIDSHGTKVVLLGNDADANTVAAPEGAAAPSRWIARYLNTRYLQFPSGITVKAREGWEHPRSDRDRNLLRTVTGQKPYLEKNKASSGRVQLAGAVAHWWVLKNDSALGQNSGLLASSGHVAALFRDELYEMGAGRAGVARLQQFGVIFGYERVVIYLEPDATSDQVTPNTARTHLLLGGEPLPWADWASEFRERLPTEIQDVIEEVGSATTPGADYRAAIRERLKQIAELFRVSRYRRATGGPNAVDPESAAGGRPKSRDAESQQGGGGRSGNAGGRAGNIYGLFLSGGVPGEPVHGMPEIRVQWISAAEGTRTQGLLEDRAAHYLPDQNLLQINADFRVFTDLVDRWRKQYANVPGARGTIEEAVREWFEQTLQETVLGLQALRASQEWTLPDLNTSFSDIALTAAVMPRYHIDVAVKRALGAKLGTLKAKA